MGTCAAGAGGAALALTGTGTTGVGSVIGAVRSDGTGVTGARSRRKTGAACDGAGADTGPEGADCQDEGDGAGAAAASRQQTPSAKNPIRQNRMEAPRGPGQQPRESKILHLAAPRNQGGCPGTPAPLLRSETRPKEHGMAGYGEFLKGLLLDPKGVSAPTPSSPALAAAIAAQVDPGRPGLVVELGAGTGVVTEALLARGVAAGRLLIVEHGTFFAEMLARRFSDAMVVRGDAFAFESYLPGGARVAAIVSGVPLLNFPPAARLSLITRALAAQGPAGRFIQLSYGWRPPVAPGHAFDIVKRLVWRNLPPAHIWTYSAALAGARAVPQNLALNSQPAGR
jgi:phosphatidylethanolamine/phosphatidyl-N-methylethanolamine N-methyltransferase